LAGRAPPHRDGSTAHVQRSYGIHSIDHFALKAPSLAEASRFLDAYGLTLQNRIDW
jgi:hypothetical protein